MTRGPMHNNQLIVFELGISQEEPVCPLPSSNLVGRNKWGQKIGKLQEFTIPFSSIYINTLFLGLTE